MNTCARIENSGKAGRIQCSKETAALIEKGHPGWLEKRADTVNLKGKGTLQTYWVAVPRERTESLNSVVSESLDVVTPKIPGLSEKSYRLVNWNVEMLLQIMKQMASLRTAKKKVSLSSSVVKAANFRSSSKKRASMFDLDLGKTPLEEVREIISLPEFDEKAASEQKKLDEVEIPRVVVEQLHFLVSKIALMYNNNPFHK